MMSSPRQSAASTLKSSIQKDKVYTLEDWLRKSKEFLRQKCSRYGLPTFGKKIRLAQRLITYLHQPSFSMNGSSSSTVTSGIDEEIPSVSLAAQGQAGPSSNADVVAPQQDQEEQNPQEAEFPPEAMGIPPQQAHGTEPQATVVAVQLEELRALIREEVSIQNGRNSSSSQQQQGTGNRNITASFPLQRLPNQQLSPASVHLPSQMARYQSSSDQNQTAPSLINPALLTTDAVNHTNPQLQQLPSYPEASQLQPGNLLQLSPCSQLPPLSAKVQKALENREYIDLTSLLPNNLYDAAASPVNFQFSTGDDQKPNVTTVSAPSAQKPKIATMGQWLEAWNIFIRGMVHFHPSLASQLLAYQESMCTLMRAYQFTACYRYDVAARLNIASNLGSRWDIFYDYAFNRFIRCANVAVSSSPVKCYKCLKEGHFSSSCPNDTFRAPVSSTSYKNPFHSYCRSFNSGNRCDSSCTYAHRCNKCGQGHPGLACRKINGKF